MPWLLHVCCLPLPGFHLMGFSMRGAPCPGFVGLAACTRARYAYADQAPLTVGEVKRQCWLWSLVDFGGRFAFLS